MFDLFDSNGGGTIDAEELDLALKSVDIQLTPEDLQEVLFAMDKDGKKLLLNRGINRRQIEEIELGPRRYGIPR